MQRALEPIKIVETVDTLRKRIFERFPTSSLLNLTKEVLTISQEAIVRTQKIRSPNWILRIGVYIIFLLCPCVLILVGSILKISDNIVELTTFISLAEATLGTFVFLGAGAYYLTNLEGKLKRNRALAAIHELRALAHIVDMHQLTKDPDALHGYKRTESSPKRCMTPFELGRYLDYCDELLSMISKIAALYVQHFPDPEAMAAVDQVETLTNGLSRKIWQKIHMLEIEEK